MAKLDVVILGFTGAAEPGNAATSTLAMRKVVQSPQSDQSKILAA